MSHSKPLRRVDPEDEPEEDHLEVDKPVPGQNFTCVSFISPEKVLKKEEFTFFNYYKCKMTEHINRLKSNMEALIEKVEDNKVKLSDVIHLKNMDKGFNIDLLNFEEWKEKYEDFLFLKVLKLVKFLIKQINFKQVLEVLK